MSDTGSHEHDRLKTVDTTKLDEEKALARRKTEAILSACKWKDLESLKSLAESGGGFLSDENRREAWPTLLGISKDQTERQTRVKQREQGASVDWKELPRHRDEDQVQLDVNRSFIYYPNEASEAQLQQHRKQLSCLIVEVLRRYPFLCYFQGYHDICQVFLLVLPPSWRVSAVSRLSTLRIRDFMLPNLRPTTAQLRLLPDILGLADADLRKHIATIEPFYALSGTLTMYAHNIEAYQDIARLFDVFLSHEPVFTVYIFAQIVLDRRDEILDIDDPDMLQVVLAKVPLNMDLDALIGEAVLLYQRFPPESLRSWRFISKYSCLKTARDIDACVKQDLDQAQTLFQQQAREIRRADLRDKLLLAIWRRRRPIKAFGAATMVAVIAFYIRRNPSLLRYILSLFDAPAQS